MEMMAYRDNNGIDDNDNDNEDDQIVSAQNTQDDTNTNQNIVTPPLAFGSNRIARDRDEQQYINSNNLDDKMSALEYMLNDMKIMLESPNAVSNEEALLSSLTGEQQSAIEIIRRGENIYINGNPGTGKSYLLLKLKRILSDKNVIYLSPNGISAENIGGVTLHSYFNIDVGEPYKFKPSDIQKPDIIVIDEVSMLSGELLDIISRKAMKLWKSTLAMGGCQVVLVGDFYQLPPIEKKRDDNRRQRITCPITSAGNIGSRGYCFQSKTWLDLSLHNVTLTEAKRQSDPFFYDVLNKIRIGNRLNNKEYGYLQQCKEEQKKKLFVRKISVHQYNMKEYNKINDDNEVTYFKAMKQYPNGIKFEKNETIRLKVGVEVMLNMNLRLYSPPYLVNGSRGIIQSFISADVVIRKLDAELTVVTDNNILKDYYTCIIEVLKQANAKKYPVVEFKDQENRPFYRCILPVRKNDYNRTTEIDMPLTYAYALTVYKSQGLSFDKLSVDLADCQELSTAYVALSRCKDASCLHVENIEVLHNMIRKGPHKIVKDFYETGSSRLWANDIDDYFSEVIDFKCQCCGGSSKKCYDSANPPIKNRLKELMKDECTETEMNKILSALQKQGYDTMARLKSRNLTEQKLEIWFEKEGEIRDRVVGDAIGAIQLIFREG